MQCRISPRGYTASSIDYKLVKRKETAIFSYSKLRNSSARFRVSLVSQEDHPPRLLKAPRSSFCCYIPTWILSIGLFCGSGHISGGLWDQEIQQLHHHSLLIGITGAVAIRHQCPHLLWQIIICRDDSKGDVMALCIEILVSGHF